MPRATDSDAASTPGHAVRRTGFALLEQGEAVFAAADSMLEAERLAEDAGALIRYEFPVTVEVRALPATIDQNAIAAAALSSLANGLASTS